MSGKSRDITTYEADNRSPHKWQVNIIREYDVLHGAERNNRFFMDIQVLDKLDWKESRALAGTINRCSLRIKNLRWDSDAFESA